MLPGWPDGFEGTTAAFNSRWNGRLITSGSKLWNRSGIRKSGSFSLADSPSGNYNNNTQTSIRRMTKFSLAGRRGCRLFYDMRLATEQGVDGFQINAGLTTFASTALDGWSGSTGGVVRLRVERLLALRRPRRHHAPLLALQRPDDHRGRGLPRQRQHALPRRHRRLVPVARRHLDGDAPRRRRSRPTAGAQPGAVGRRSSRPRSSNTVDTTPDLEVLTNGRLQLFGALNSVADGAAPEGYYTQRPAGEDQPDDRHARLLVERARRGHVHLLTRRRAYASVHVAGRPPRPHRRQPTRSEVVRH